VKNYTFGNVHEKKDFSSAKTNLKTGLTVRPFRIKNFLFFRLGLFVIFMSLWTTEWNQYPRD
jgi:hypothetical protein